MLKIRWREIIAVCGLFSILIETPVLAAHERRPLSYTELEQALMAGADIAITIDLSQCFMANDDKQAGPSIKGGFHIKDFIIPNQNYIAFSNVHKTLSADNRPTTEYMRYRVMSDGKITVRAATVRKDEPQAQPQSDYNCSMGKAVQFFHH